MKARVWQGRVKNEKGITLILAIFLIVLILGIGEALVMRAINTNNVNQRSNASLQAFSEAESGIAFAYSEESSKGFQWYTHADIDTPITAPNTPLTDANGVTLLLQLPTPLTVPDSSIDAAGNYLVDNRSFLVKAYPEMINGIFTGVIMVHSQATVNGITRTVEYRLGQVNPYQYFFFYSSDTFFGNATWDGRNFGGIHVNGDILFRYNPNFFYLTELSSGSDTTGKGYIRRSRSQYPDLSGLKAYTNSAFNPQGLDSSMVSNSQGQVMTGKTTFTTGLLSSPTTTELDYYLDNDQYAGADWNYLKYAGATTNTTPPGPTRYTISDTSLYNLATYELVKGTDSVSLFDPSKNVNVPSVGIGPENEIFEELFNRSGVAGGVWDNFWDDWRENHEEDYEDFYGAGQPLTGGEDWERRFYLAAYNWTGMGDGVPDNINREWWQDLSYGDDRTSVNFTAAAAVENSATGIAINQYFLDTQQQSSAWRSWLRANSLNELGNNKTRVQDASQGGKYLDPGSLFSFSANVVSQEALNGGVYIGINPTTGAFQNPIAGCSREKNFYNAVKPATNGLGGMAMRYRPSNVLEIDVACLRNMIDTGGLTDFNGIVYVDLSGYAWPSPNNDNDISTGVMLVNGQRLPDNGLSLVTLNNVFIKGDYNLDPDGVSAKNRPPDDTAVTDRYSSDPLEWQPAEIITQREVYTLSNDFAEPKAMPLINSITNQNSDEMMGWTSANVLDDPYWGKPGATWMPATTLGTYNGSNNINNWFNWSGTTRPPSWTKAWIESNWGTYNTGDSNVYSYDLDGDGSNETYILRQDLKNDLYRTIDNAYNTEYAYNTSRSATDYQLANPVNATQIYNTAIVTPYSTDPLVLERWNSRRTINGAFIQLANTFQLPVPEINSFANGRYSTPIRTFNYESRFGRNSNAEDRPLVGLTFAVDSSWREINNANF